jgi:hypothetical protein
MTQVKGLNRLGCDAKALLKADTKSLNPAGPWLREKGVTMSPDELVSDNLSCIFRSAPSVERKAGGPTP